MQLPLVLLVALIGGAWHPHQTAAFDTPVHTEILKDALGNKMSDDSRAIVEGYNGLVTGEGNQGSDAAAGQMMPFLHFDSAKNPNEICDRWKEGWKSSLAEAVTWAQLFAYRDAFGGSADHEANARRYSLQEFGIGLHALEDFYSHSNWVEIADDNNTLSYKPGSGAAPLAPLLGDTCDPNAFPKDNTTGEVAQTGYVSFAWWLFNWTHLHLLGAWCDPALGPASGFKYCHDDIAKDSNTGYGAKFVTGSHQQVIDGKLLITRFEWAQALATAETAAAWGTYTAQVTAAINGDSRLTSKGVDAGCIINKIAYGGDDNCVKAAGSGGGCTQQNWWNGKWADSDNGRSVNLTQAGAKVTGTWDDGLDPMAVQATTDDTGTELNGTWWDGTEGGSLRYTMDAPCRQFSGIRFGCYLGTPPPGRHNTSDCDSGNTFPESETFRPVTGSMVLPPDILDSARSPQGQISGTPPPGAPQVQPPDWTVPFQTSRGLMQLTPNGGELTGSYDQGKGQIIAVAAGKVLKGAWFHAPSFMPPNDAGDIDFTLAADNNSFSGMWKGSSDGVWHTDWTGTRTTAPSSPPPQVTIPWLSSAGTGGSPSPSASPSASPSPSPSRSASPSPSPSPSPSVSPSPGPSRSPSPSPSPTAGGCTQWNVAGTWHVTQGNGYSPTLNIQQSGTTITGTINYSASDQAKANFVSNSGGLTGTLTGNQLQFTTSPFAKKDGTTSQAQYTGTVSAGQSSNGTAVDVANTFYKTTWSATGTATCAGGSGASGSSSSGGGSSSSGPSSSGGGQMPKLGPIDWNGYCKSIGNTGASLDGGTINDWHCVDASGKKTGINPGAAFQWQYGTNVAKWDTFNDPNSWACFG